MPFLRHEISVAYMESPLPMESGFAQEIKARGNTRRQQALYERMRQCMNARQLALVDAYLECVGIESELTEMHYFQEGWLACEQHDKTAEVM